jgi:hypothetical protein
VVELLPTGHDWLKMSLQVIDHYANWLPKRTSNRFLHRPLKNLSPQRLHMKEMNRMISRRKFLKSTALASEAFTAGLSSTRAAAGSVGGETYKTKKTIELSSDNPPGRARFPRCSDARPMSHPGFG